MRIFFRIFMARFTIPFTAPFTAPFRTLFNTVFIVIFMLAITTMTEAQTLKFKDINDRANRPTPTHKIAYGNHADQYGELWLPETKNGAQNTAQKLPVVILVHGGCWRADLPGPELVAFLADALRREGVAVWSITYRRVGTKPSAPSEKFSPYPDTFFDVANAADKLNDLAATFNLDLTRVVTTGHSAGGHLAMWLAARPRLPKDSPLYVAKDTTKPLAINATVGIASLSDLEYTKIASAQACGEDTVDLLVDSKNRKDNVYRDTSVPLLLPLNLPQTLISGSLDKIAAPAHALRYRENAAAKAETVSLITIEGSGHFELIAPWTAPGKLVVETIVAALLNKK